MGAHHKVVHGKRHGAHSQTDPLMMSLQSHSEFWKIVLIKGVSKTSLNSLGELRNHILVAIVTQVSKQALSWLPPYFFQNCP